MKVFYLDKELQFDAPVSAFDIAKQLKIDSTTLACKLDGKPFSLCHIVDKDCTFEPLTFQDELGRRSYRATAAFLLAQAMRNVYPTAQLAAGGTDEDGFYYDFDFRLPITQADFEKIETEMRSIIKGNLPIEEVVGKRKDAEKFVAASKMTYKAEHLAGIKGEYLTAYKHADFYDTSDYPLLRTIGKVKAFKLTALTGAYWQGNEKNKMLTRIYGTAFEKKSELDAYLQGVEDAKARDHNKVGRELGLFMSDENIGQGLPLFMPAGARVLQIMQRFVEDEEQKRGYLLTKTPIMSKNNLFITSGHWDHYKDKMFYIGEEDVDDEILCLRPMTCPFQFTIYKNGLKSYRDLPIRYAETATLFRKEASGEMHGLTRIRQFTLSDGHIVCTPDQLEQEFAGAVDLIRYLMGVLGIQDDVTYRFSRWDEHHPKKYVGTKRDWNKAENAMRKILDDLGIDYEEAVGEAAFYGPKLDVQGRNVHGKEDTLFTVQIDFALATRFDMIYIDENGEKQRPLIIHRSSIGCYERTLAMLIEKYNGAFPLWLAPEQVRVASLTDRTTEQVVEVKNRLLALGLRTEVDVRNEKLGKKIRDAQLAKVPYTLVIGDKEAENGTVSVRHRTLGNLGTMPLGEFAGMALMEAATKEIK